MTAPDGDPLKIRVSAGIAWYPEDAVTLDDLLRCSDYAMYSSKNEAKGTLREFNPDQYDHEAYLIHGTGGVEPPDRTRTGRVCAAAHCSGVRRFHLRL